MQTSETDEPDLFDICARNHAGNPESSKARRRTNADVDRAKVYEAIRGSGPAGMTCDEVEVELGMLHQSCSARVSELKMKGKVITSGVRPTRTGCKAAVLVAIQL